MGARIASGVKLLATIGGDAAAACLGTPFHSLFHDVRSLRGTQTLATRRMLASLLSSAFSAGLFAPLAECLRGRFVNDVNNAALDRRTALDGLLSALRGREWRLATPTDLDRLWYEMCSALQAYFGRTPDARIPEVERDLDQYLVSWT
jgi:hypothetical protein